jgi:uncharacterized protein with HEPN domain
MENEPRASLEIILNSAGKIREYVEGMTYETFRSEKVMQRAMESNFGVIGREIGRIDESIRQTAPDVAWQELIDLGENLEDDFIPVDYKDTWDAVTNKLGPLENACRAMLATVE